MLYWFSTFHSSTFHSSTTGLTHAGSGLETSMLTYSCSTAGVCFDDNSGSSFNKSWSISISSSYFSGMACSWGSFLLYYPSSGSPIFSTMSFHKILRGFVSTNTFFSEVVWVLSSFIKTIELGVIGGVCLSKISFVKTELTKWDPSEKMTLKLSGKLTLIKSCWLLQDPWQWLPRGHSWGFSELSFPQD